MRRILTAVITLLCICSQGQSTQAENPSGSAQKTTRASSHGAKISPEGVAEGTQMATVFEDMATTDTLELKLRGKIKEVCQVKGCWMKVALDQQTEVMVRFRDYGFFVPLDAAGKEVILSGTGFTELISVDDQRHYAEDAGMTPTEIAAIREPLKAYSIVADGVLIGD